MIERENKSRVPCTAMSSNSMMNTCFHLSIVTAHTLVPRFYDNHTRQLDDTIARDETANTSSTRFDRNLTAITHRSDLSVFSFWRFPGRPQLAMHGNFIYANEPLTSCEASRCIDQMRHFSFHHTSAQSTVLYCSD